MGFFSDCWSAIKSVGSAAVEVVRTTFDNVREKARDALDWMATKAESFVGKVKEVWSKVKPFIANVVRPALKIAAEWATVALPTFPWVATAIRAFDKALEALLNWEKSALAKQVKAAVEWAIAKAKMLRDIFLNDKEMEQAAAHEEVLREAREDVRGEAGRALDLATLITQYAQLSTRIQQVLENNNISDFDHYLRLRASQKLLKDTEQRLIHAQDLEAINRDDLFLVEIGAELLKANPLVSDDQAVRLDEVIHARFGKKLIPFVFEELIMAWGCNLEQQEKDWKTLSESVARLQVQERQLKISQNLGEPSAEDKATLAEIQARLPALKAQMDQLRKRNQEMRNYVYAAEGFLQVLEKQPEDFADDAYLLSDSQEVGMIIIDCAQHGKRWEELTEDEQSLIIDFANIFEEASRERAGRLVEVAA
ncbi:MULTISPECIES: hypothetical protein [unclassified Pseudomonas]|uniref:hypothetical protein n=1 Tax=unclassified Pseudomonas TaxID=196821 RepID=UPI001A9EF8BC|nr:MULTISPECIES: hypothetical protein [unclassified Pseudomonas]MCE5985423.1 hypothetical protein [Pseudomonas sp. LM20]MCE5990562.1 hypothetical protein [Pseudomonas sp. KCA11]UMY59749.1 hypothetical protein MKK04_16130 [Pseudomonas sp. LS.1a]